MTEDGEQRGTTACRFALMKLRFLAGTDVHA
jgi:hypothetical protein